MKKSRSSFDVCPASNQGSPDWPGLRIQLGQQDVLYVQEVSLDEGDIIS